VKFSVTELGDGLWEHGTYGIREFLKCKYHPGKIEPFRPYHTGNSFISIVLDINFSYHGIWNELSGNYLEKCLNPPLILNLMRHRSSLCAVGKEAPYRTQRIHVI